ncbi:hypothetical protein, partial [Vibrio hyugaensis]|uniref:hypothetical protein n=1 Tax=Vibrio hyugaensis TaxID=1534743 RepID=UPI0011B068AF
MIKNNSPFIIWTFRRSGGTNLGDSLFNNSKYNAVEHEPFNVDRRFNYVINKWKNEKNIDVLYSDIEEIIKNKPLIKHCLEIMPSELNTALLEISTKYGYKHLFLYREMAKSRLLSLNYSIKTNVWGKEHLLTRPFDDAVFDEKIPIEKLIEHERVARESMKSLYSKLVELKQKPLSVSFEQLYRSDFSYSSLLVRSLFKELIGSDEFVSEEFLDKTLRGGGQGTNGDYLRFPNSDDFIARMDDLDRFKLYEDKEVKHNAKEKHCIEYFELWKTLPGINSEQFYVHGVCLSSEPFNLAFRQSQIEIIRGLKSDNMHRRFPENIHAQNCRFIAGPIECIDNLNIDII